jgi:hypothetical protein
VGAGRARRRLLPPGNRVVEVLSSQDWPSGAYLTALLPVAITMVLLAGEARRQGLRPVLERWRWVLLTLVAIPVHYLLRVAFGRPGPREVAGGGRYVGAYPSGTALAVGLGWTLCLLVAGAFPLAAAARSGTPPRPQAARVLNDPAPPLDSP